MISSWWAIFYLPIDKKATKIKSRWPIQCQAASFVARLRVAERIRGELAQATGAYFDPVWIRKVSPNEFKRGKS